MVQSYNYHHQYQHGNIVSLSSPLPTWYNHTTIITSTNMVPSSHYHHQYPHGTIISLSSYNYHHQYQYGTIISISSPVPTWYHHITISLVTCYTITKLPQSPLTSPVPTWHHYITTIFIQCLNHMCHHFHQATTIITIIITSTNMVPSYYYITIHSMRPIITIITTIITYLSLVSSLSLKPCNKASKLSL